MYRAELTARLDAQSAAELNRLLAGDTGFGDGVNLALRHPVDSAIGGAKGIVNGGLALADLMARGEAMRAASDADQAAAIQSLFGKTFITRPSYTRWMTGTSASLPLMLDQGLRRELVAGERLLWSVQPRAARLKGGFGIWLFAIPWTAFALFWEAMAFLPWMASSKTPDAVAWSFGIVFPLFGLPFIAIGFWMLWQPIRAMRQARFTTYALTSRRLLRLINGSKREMASVMLDQMGPLSRTERPDGSGDLRVQTHSHVDSEGDRTTECFEVLGVPDVARLERLILENRVG